MNIFKRLFSKKDDAQEAEKEPEKADGFEAEERETDQRRIGHYVLDHCEQIIEAARNLGFGKREYGVVTSYLKDIETLTDMPDAQKAPIRDAAEHILRLSQARSEYLNATKKISDAQYVMMEQYEDDMPDIIRGMQSNEAYQSAVRHDMACLEGEKMQWTILRGDMSHEKYVLRIASCILFSAYALLMILLFVLQAGFGVDAAWGWLIVTAVAGLGGFAIFMRYQNAVKETARSEVNANHAISLLNKMKIKYVNITNAVDYSCEKYHVRSAAELEYQWEQYQEAVREKQRYMRNSDELDYYSKKLVSELQKYRLYDANAWVDQPAALLQPAEMSEMKHNLLVRRQKLRARIQYNAKVVETERGHVDRLMQLHPEYEDEIREIIRSVDKLSAGGL